MPAYTHTHPPTHPSRHFIDRKALWDTCREIGRLILPSESRRILLNYRGKYEFETKKHIQRFYDTCNSRKYHLKFFVKFLLDSIEFD